MLSSYNALWLGTILPSLVAAEGIVSGSNDLSPFQPSPQSFYTPSLNFSVDGNGHIARRRQSREQNTTDDAKGSSPCVSLYDGKLEIDGQVVSSDRAGLLNVGSAPSSAISTAWQNINGQLSLNRESRFYWCPDNTGFQYLYVQPLHMNNAPCKEDPFQIHLDSGDPTCFDDGQNDLSFDLPVSLSSPRIGEKLFADGNAHHRHHYHSHHYHHWHDDDDDCSAISESECDLESDGPLDCAPSRGMTKSPKSTSTCLTDHYTSTAPSIALPVTVSSSISYSQAFSSGTWPVASQTDRNGTSISSLLVLTTSCVENSTSIISTSTATSSSLLSTDAPGSSSSFNAMQQSANSTGFYHNATATDSSSTVYETTRPTSLGSSSRTTRSTPTITASSKPPRLTPPLSTQIADEDEDWDNPFEGLSTILEFDKFLLAGFVVGITAVLSLL